MRYLGKREGRITAPKHQEDSERPFNCRNALAWHLYPVLCARLMLGGNWSVRLLGFAHSTVRTSRIFSLTE
jgi:hypothetical protein